MSDSLTTSLKVSRMCLARSPDCVRSPATRVVYISELLTIGGTTCSAATKWSASGSLCYFLDYIADKH